MLKTNFLLIVFACFAINNIRAQSCTGLGQNPGTAFPVCGTATFTQSTVPNCGGRFVPCPCGADPVTDINPYWYKFTCFATGTLSFLIAPNTSTDDYDWQLFDVTGKNPGDVYTNASLFVACNWSGETGNTGANSTGTSLIRCGGEGIPLFSSMPTLLIGHQYILLISHFTPNSQSGYTLTFGGGTASITDPVDPHLLSAKAPCDGSKISVKLNKQMKCSSIDADGSDFILIPAIAPIIGAAGVGCTNSFDTDSVTITLGAGLPPGNYKITTRAGNNLLDNCNNFIPPGDTLNVTVYPLVPTPMDSLTKPACAPTVLQLVFRSAMQCSSIAANGSDFFMTGLAGITIIGAEGVCSTDGLTNTINVKLSGPVQRAGTYTLHLQAGSDGNSIINECGVETPAGARVSFTTQDTVNAAFVSTIHFGCLADTVAYTHPGGNSINSWRWAFDNTLASTAKDTAIVYPVFGNKNATLIVSNGTCSDTATNIINLNNQLIASFEATAVVCPGDPAVFNNTSVSGHSATWAWAFGNGSLSTQQTPPQQFYPSSNNITDVPVRLIITNDIGCSDTATHTIKVVGNCYIAIPKGFSPNGDGLNDYLYPTNAYKAKALVFRVYNRIGQLLFETKDWTNKWDGTYKGSPQDPGTYIWILNYTNIDTGQRFELKGATVLIR